MKRSTKRRYWTAAEDATLRSLYPDTPTKDIAARMARTERAIYHHALSLGLRKSSEYLAGPHAQRMRRGDGLGIAYRFPKGHVPFNKGLRRPGWAPGRMAQTQFKKGSRSKRWDPDQYAIGALRWNGEYVDIKISETYPAWRPFHLWLWEQENGRLPKGHAVIFRDGDRLNIDLANLEIVSRADLMRRNTLHRLPQPLRSSIQLLGQLKRRIRERAERTDA